MLSASLQPVECADGGRVSTRRRVWLPGEPVGHVDKLWGRPGKWSWLGSEMSYKRDAGRVREDSAMWFADKLGPVPKASPQGKAHPQAATPASGKAAKNAQVGGSQPKGQAPRAQP